jgi:hypothetical protein
MCEINVILILKSPDVYQLYRRNKTVDRHASQHHEDNLSAVVVKPYYDESVRKSQEECEGNKNSAKSGSWIDSTSGNYSQ